MFFRKNEDNFASSGSKNPFKRLLLIVVVFFAILIVVGVVLPAVKSITLSKSPVVSISASNDKVYSADQKIKLSDFDVEAEHENGKSGSLGTDQYEISTDHVNPTGESTKITVTYKGDKKITCTVKVNAERDEVASFPCGYPNIDSVKAVLYSNGELCFEGGGDVLTYNEREFPWQGYSDADHGIEYVTFEKGVKPSNMNFWFENMSSLLYVDPIPDSVQSMCNTFANCESLTSMADWSNCSSLININEAYMGCTALEKTVPVPASVKTADLAFQGCTNLQSTPGLEGAASLQSAVQMFKDCQKLVTVSISPALQDMNGMFLNCINLKKMPEIPATVQDMDQAFEGDVSLAEMTSIPASVTSAAQCFNGCEMLSGTLVVDAEPENFSGMFSGAAIATEVDLTGNSRLLDALANTTDSGHVTVNGFAPNPDILYYHDVIDSRP